MSDTVREAVHEAFPDRMVDEIEAQNTRPGNEAGRVTFVDDETVYVKTATDTPTRLRREIAATRYAGANCPIQTPDVVAADADGSVPYLVTRPLPGTVLYDPWREDDADRTALLRRAGRAIAGIHEVTFDQPGIITDGDADGLDLAESSWTDTLCRTIQWRAMDWFSDRFQDAPGRLIELIREAEPSLDGNSSASLLHADCSLINIHLDPNGLLDWERALVGDPPFALADATFHLATQPGIPEDQHDSLETALHDGYRQRAGSLPPGFEERRALYQVISYLLVVQTFDDWAPDEDEPTDAIEAKVREEFDERIDAAREVLLPDA